MDANILETAAATASHTPRFLGMHTEVAAIWATLAVGFVQMGAVAWGLLHISRSSRQFDEQFAKQHEESQKRFEETVRKNDRRFEKIAQNRLSSDALDTSTDALRASTDALRAALERFNSPPAQPATD